MLHAVNVPERALALWCRGHAWKARPAALALSIYLTLEERPLATVVVYLSRISMEQNFRSGKTFSNAKPSQMQDLSTKTPEIAPAVVNGLFSYCKTRAVILEVSREKKERAKSGTFSKISFKAKKKSVQHRKAAHSETTRGIGHCKQEGDQSHSNIGQYSIRRATIL